MNSITTAVKNIFSSEDVPNKIGTINSIDGLNATILEQNGNTLSVVLLNSSFKLGNTVLVTNGIVQRIVDKQKPIKTVRV